MTWRVEIAEHGTASPISNGVIPWFSVSTQVHDRTAIVSVSGELDLATGSILSDSVRCHDGHYEQVVLDLSELSFIDVAGFRAILDCIDDEASLIIRDPSPAAHQLLSLLRREDLIQGASGRGSLSSS